MQLPNRLKASPWLQIGQWMFEPLKYMENAAAKYPDMFTVHWGKNQPIVMVNHPDLVKELLTNKALSAPGYINEIVKPLVGDNSLLLLSGDHHKRQRKLLMPPFHGERMFNYGRSICAITEKAISQYPLNQPFPMRNLTKDITMDVILQTVFGLYDSDRYQKIKQLIGERLQMTSSPLGAMLIFLPRLQKDWGRNSPWGRIVRKIREIDELIYAEIRERRHKLDPERTDILSLLLMARDENGEGMTDIELRDELITLLVAGHETTASSLAWGFYWLQKYPQVCQKLLGELDSLGANPDPMTIFKLPYLKAVCNEVLRIYPAGILTFPRIVNFPVEIGGFPLQTNTVLIGSIYLTHNREDLYPEPKQFKPERFLEHQFSPYEFVPFGGGARRCIGYALAELELRLVLATIMSGWELELTQKQVKPKRRGLLLAPSGGVEMVIKGRREQS